MLVARQYCVTIFSGLYIKLSHGGGGLKSSTDKRIDDFRTSKLQQDARIPVGGPHGTTSSRSLRNTMYVVRNRATVEAPGDYYYVPNNSSSTSYSHTPYPLPPITYLSIFPLPRVTYPKTPSIASYAD